MITYTWLLFLCLTRALTYSQEDTIIQKRHYTAFGYYPGAYERLELETDEPKTLFFLGNYESNLKTGHWLYFFPTGLLLAEGEYDKGVKTGKWTYYSIKQKRSVVMFSAKYPAVEKICFGPGNSPLIYDVRIAEKYPKHLVNGLRIPQEPTIQLD